MSNAYPQFAPELRGIVHTPAGRPVWWTGKVCIGLRSGESAHAPRRLSTLIDHRVSADAEAIQAALLRSQPKRKPCKVRAIKPRCGLPTLTPTTTLWRLWAWVMGVLQR